MPRPVRRSAPTPRRLRAEQLEDRAMLSIAPQLLVDINTQQSSNPREFTEFQGRLYYVADHADYGSELWTSDGTPEGTHLVADINPGVNGSSPAKLTPFGEWLYFSADNPEHGRELWRVDASGGATMTEIRSGHESSILPNMELDMVAANGRLYFLATSNEVYGLWTTDGFSPPISVIPSFAQSQIRFHSMAILGSDLYVAYSDNLAKIDTASNTLSHVLSFPYQLNPKYVIQPLDGTLFIFSNGRQWLSDGTKAGTSSVIWSHTDTDNGVAFGESFYTLSPYGELYRSHAAAGEQRIFALQLSARHTSLVATSNRLYFIADSGFGPEIWTSDGNSNGASMLHRFRLEESPSFDTVTELNGDFYFTIGGIFEKAALWKSDGTVAGTTLVASEIGPRDWLPDAMLAVGDRVYFQGNRQHGGVELWFSDGTPLNLASPRDLPAKSDPSNPANLVVVGSKLYFTATDGDGEKLWITDGAPENAQWLFDGKSIGELTPVGDQLYFTSFDHLGNDILHFTDGTREGTHTVAFPGLVQSLYNLTRFQDQLFVGMKDETSRHYLYRAESGVATLVVTLGTDPNYDPPFNSVRSHRPTAVTNDAFYFYVSFYSGAPSGVWRSDGTREGTFPVADLIGRGFTYRPSEMIAIGDHVYFDGGYELWRTDGTSAGTKFFKDITAFNLTSAGNRLFFMDEMERVWRLDETSAAPELNNGNYTLSYSVWAPENPRLAEFHGALYYLATRRYPETTALWRTAGNGTLELAVELSGDVTPSNYGVRTIDGSLYFSLNSQLYLSDGTARGTIALPLDSSVSPADLVPFNGKLVLPYNLAGRELAFFEVDTRVNDAHLFYNDSAFDGQDSELTAADDLAIATDKSPYRVGDGPATLENVSSYGHGINGLMLDFAYLAQDLSAENFAFRVGTTDDLATWTTAPAPTAITTRGVPSDLGSTINRVSLAWPNGAIANTWLEVTVLANQRTGLNQPEVFYFGSKVADSGTDPVNGPFQTTPADSLQIFSFAGSFKAITDPRDYNRDGQITPADALLVYANAGTLVRLNLPAASPQAGPLAGAESTSREQGDAVRAALNLFVGPETPVTLRELNLPNLSLPPRVAQSSNLIRDLMFAAAYEQAERADAEDVDEEFLTDLLGTATRALRAAR